MQINNINDNPPVFEKAEYREIVLEVRVVLLTAYK